MLVRFDQEDIGNNLAGCKTLFLIDNIIADEALNIRRQHFLGLAISGRQKRHLLWILTQCYTAIPMNIRRQAKMLYVWYPKKRGDWDTIHDENDIIETREKLVSIKKQLKRGKHACLLMST